MSDFDDYGQAEGGGRGVWFGYKSRNEAGIHLVEVSRVIYRPSQNPKHRGFHSFIAECNVLTSNVHEPGSTRSYVVNTKHQPSADNIKRFMVELFVAMGYKREEVVTWPLLPGADPSKGSKTYWGDMCAWIVGPANPCAQYKPKLRVESNLTVKSDGGDFTLNTFSQASAPAPLPQAA
jgi:hypothetical protein